MPARIDDASRDWLMNGVSFNPGLGLLVGAGIILYRSKQEAYR